MTGARAVRRPLAVTAALVVLGTAGAHAAVPTVELITDRAGRSEAAGSSAVKWGFMCSIFARRGDRLCAVTFARPPDEPWDARKPNEAPVAFWEQDRGGAWHSTLLDGPRRTYQTPTLLLEQDGRADVFTLQPGDTTIHWFRGKDAANSSFERRELPIPWGAYMGGAMDERGRVLLAYWGTTKPGPDAGLYENGAVGWTLVDTRTGRTQNGVAEATGVPYCYPQVAFDRTGAHILTVRSEVKSELLVGSRNHYIEMRYYHCDDPSARNASWQRTVMMSDPRALIQPLGCVTDGAGRVHLLYCFYRDEGGGKFVPPTLVYAVSRAPVSRGRAPEFVKHTIRDGGWDGRLCRTSDGRVHVMAYRAGNAIELATVLDGVAGRFSDWQRFELPVGFCRVFPLRYAGRASLARDIECLLVGVPGTANESSLYALRLDLGGRAR